MTSFAQSGENIPKLNPWEENTIKGTIVLGLADLYGDHSICVTLVAYGESKLKGLSVSASSPSQCYLLPPNDTEPPISVLTISLSQYVLTEANVVLFSF